MGGFEQEGEQSFGDESDTSDVGLEGGFELLFESGSFGVYPCVVHQDV